MMKKLIILIALVAAPAALAAAQPTAVTAVSIEAQRALITYGNATTLSGAVTPAQKVDVTVVSKPCLNPPQRVPQATPLTLKSAATGTWSISVAPQVRTLYQATAQDAQSETVMVQVRPRVTLARLARHTFRARASAAESFVGKAALFQKRSLLGWKTVKRVPLALVTATSDTVVSGRTFHSGVSAHKTVRLVLTQGQVGNCYAPGVSNAVRS